MSTQLCLERVSDAEHHAFTKPAKEIHDGADVTFFLTSRAYRDIVTFALQLNRSLVPRKNGTGVQTWALNSSVIVFSDAVNRLRQLIQELRDIMLEAPPDPGPRRFGNASFRKWYQLIEQRCRQLLSRFLGPGFDQAHVEIEAYFLGSFGSPQRLDYGTGHELSFLAFLGCLSKLGYFDFAVSGLEERGIVLGVFEQYLELIRALIKTYTLEPAGSHGVWGLDDNSFLPYMFGSAQLCPAISDDDETPVEGSIQNAPEPGFVTSANLVEKERNKNMYFSAVAFIYDVKKGPFWEHSPMLYDISGIKDGWGKINKGMIKMYNAEVLSKFPVIQHFPFGSLFKWEKDPSAQPPPSSTHVSNQPLRDPTDTYAPSMARPGAMRGPINVTQAPWTARPPPSPAGFLNGVTVAPWAGRAPGSHPQRDPQARITHPSPNLSKGGGNLNS